MTDIQAFVEKHGGPAVRLAGNGSACMVCKDGASYTVGLGTTFLDPPEYARRLKWRRTYHQTLLDDAEVDVKRLDAAMRGIGARWQYPQPGDYRIAHYQPFSQDGKTMLETLRAIVARERQAVAELDQQIAAARPAGAVSAGAAVSFDL